MPIRKRKTSTSLTLHSHLPVKRVRFTQIVDDSSETSIDLETTSITTHPSSGCSLHPDWWTAQSLLIQMGNALTNPNDVFQTIRQYRHANPLWGKFDRLVRNEGGDPSVWKAIRRTGLMRIARRLFTTDKTLLLSSAIPCCTYPRFRSRILLAKDRPFPFGVEAISILANDCRMYITSIELMRRIDDAKLMSNAVFESVLRTWTHCSGPLARLTAEELHRMIRVPDHGLCSERLDTATTAGPPISVSVQDLLLLHRCCTLLSPYMHVRLRLSHRSDWDWIHIHPTVKSVVSAENAVRQTHMDSLVMAMSPMITTTNLCRLVASYLVSFIHI
jgi:hypothetical protein